MVGGASGRGAACLILVALLSVGLLAPSPVAADHPEFADYERIVDIVGDWAALGARVEVAATTPEGRDVHMVTVGTGPFTILYLNGLHANEPGSTEGFVRFVYALLGELGPSFEGALFGDLGPDSPMMVALADPAVRAELLSKVTVVGFPMMDPDGVENAHARDGSSNSDYQTNLTHFTEAIRHAYARHTVDLMLDSHGAPVGQRGLDITIGLVEPVYAPQVVLDEARRNAATAWAAVEALGGRVSYFEEHPMRLLMDCETDPCSSIDEAYWSALSRGTLLTQSSWIVKGVPLFYTESPNLDDGVEAVLRGASANEVLMAALAFENAGMLDGTAPHTIDGSLPGDGTDVALDWTRPDGATNVLVTVQTNGASRLDRTLSLHEAAGEVAATGPDATDPMRLGTESLALAFDALPAAAYTLRSTATVAEPLDEPDMWRVVWREPDPDGSHLEGIVDAEAEPTFCWEWSSLYREVVGAVAGGLASRSC